MKMTMDAAAGTGAPRPVRVLGKSGSAASSKSAAPPKPAAKPTTPRKGKKDALTAWLATHTYPEDEIRFHDVVPACLIPDFRLPGTPGKMINSAFPDIAAKLSAGGIEVRILSRMPATLHPDGCCTPRFHTLSDDLPLKDLIRMSGLGQADLEKKSGLSSVEITASLKAPARMPRLVAIAEALGIRLDYMVTRPRCEPIICTRIDLLDMRAPTTSGSSAVLWPGAELSAELSAPEFTRTQRLSAEMLGLPDCPAREPETVSGINRAIRPFGAELLLAVLDHQAGWLLGNRPIDPEILPELLAAGPDLSERNIIATPDPEAVGLSGFNSALYDIGITHRYVLRDVRSRKCEVFDDGQVATAAQFRELSRRREGCDPA